MEGEYTIKLREEATPFSIMVPRRIPHPLRTKVQEELRRMERLGVIRKIEKPTPWCAGMVVTPKANGAVRICVDLTRLNEKVCRERYQMPSVEESLAQVQGAKIFTKLDANSGFWQIPLAEESMELTTFLTPFGRYCFQRLPFGITSAPEHFQSRMATILEGLDGIVCQMDDILIYGATQEEHDSRVQATLERIQRSGVTLNGEKCEFSKRSVKFLGQVIESSGIKSDPDKVSAILRMREPRNVGEVRRFLGMTNQLGKFSPRLAEMTKPIRDLLSKKNAWIWGEHQRLAFQEVKQVLSSDQTLSLYNMDYETVIAADASSFGVGAVISQRQPSGQLQPVAYASRVMMDTERRYAQIEKEALAITWACEKFSNNIIMSWD